MILCRVNKFTSTLITVILAASLALTQSCGFSKLFSDQVIIAALKNKQPSIIEATKFSIGVTYNSNIRYFPASGVKDSSMREKIRSLGTDVYVKYEIDNDPMSIPDSTVIFASFHDIGTVEVIYDFATHERDIPSLISNKRNFHVTKVGERTYYRRGPELR